MLKSTTTSRVLKGFPKDHPKVSKVISELQTINGLLLVNPKERLKTVARAANLFFSFRHMSALLAQGRSRNIKDMPVQKKISGPSNSFYAPLYFKVGDFCLLIQYYFFRIWKQEIIEKISSKRIILVREVRLDMSTKQFVGWGAPLKTLE